jgi:phage/plasmid-associated DNA primase
MILTCNHLPSVSAQDQGTWRRIRVVEFTSRFCENPNPDNPNEFKADHHLSEKFDLWKAPFMSWLIEFWYRRYVDEGITEPMEVLQCTLEYQKNNDVLCEFVEQELERTEDEKSEGISFADLNESFRVWCRTHNVSGHQNLKKKEFIKSISKIFDEEPIISGRNEIWKKWRFRSFGNSGGMNFVADDDDL